ncbi:MAG TPA: LysR family transcriptional regulator [Caulobacteraceae bacterium]|jgi:DNA-binding transcriptional LysR family regulator
MLDDINELRTFQRVLALGSLSAAARDLHVGLAVVSKRLAALERRTGVRLINRTTRSLSPTDEGVALLAHVERVLDELAGAEARLASGRDEPHGLLRVSAPISFGRIHLTPIAAQLVEQHPHLDVELTLNDRIVDLIEERIDVAVRIGQPRDSTAIMRKLADNRRILVAAPGYLDRRGRPTSPEDLAGHVWLRYGDGASPLRFEGPQGRVVELEARGRLRADNGDAVYDWALAGCGVMAKSSVDVAHGLRDGRLERVLPDWRSAPMPIYALWPSARHLATKARVFLEAVATRLEGCEL